MRNKTHSPFVGTEPPTINVTTVKLGVRRRYASADEIISSCDGIDIKGVNFLDGTIEQYAIVARGQ